MSVIVKNTNTSSSRVYFEGIHVLYFTILLKKVCIIDLGKMGNFMAGQLFTSQKKRE